MTDWIEANGITVRYELRKPYPGARLIVLLHEGMGMIESFDETMPQFERAFNVLRYDQRGFGLTEKPPETSIEHLVADLAGLLDALHVVERVHLVGCGFGGGIALAFAIAHPDRVDRVFVTSPSGSRDPGTELAGELATRAAIVEKHGLAAVEARFLERSYQPILRGDPARFERYRLRWRSNDPKQMGALFRVASTLYFVPLLPRIKARTLVVGCTHDARSTPPQMAELASRIPGASFVEMNSGHFACVQTPDLFAEYAVRFLTTDTA